MLKRTPYHPNFVANEALFGESFFHTAPRIQPTMGAIKHIMPMPTDNSLSLVSVKK